MLDTYCAFPVIIIVFLSDGGVGVGAGWRCRIPRGLGWFRNKVDLIAFAGSWKSWSIIEKCSRCLSLGPEGQPPEALRCQPQEGEGDMASRMTIKGTGAFLRGWRNRDLDGAINNNSHNNYFYYSGKGNG